MRLFAVAVLVAVLGSTTPVRADALGEVRARQADVQRLDQERAQLDGRRVRLEQESQALAGEIEQLKTEPAGVRRDFRLQELLPLSKAKSDELERVSADLRSRNQALSSARRELVATCDRALYREANLPEARRLELSRLRTAQVTLLTLPAQPFTLGKPAAAAAPSAFDPLDGPRDLQEKADLLRDSEDKLRREVSRLSARIDDVERRRHLRERATAVDEDWFGESTTSRTVARSATSSTSRNGQERGGGAADSATPPQSPSPMGSPTSPPTVGGGTGSSPGAGAGSGGSPGGSIGTGTGSGSGGGNGNSLGTPSFSGAGSGEPPRADSTAVLRNLVDPATLDELRRADGSDDLERQVRALRRAQGELEGLAKDLGKRAKNLSTRAQELKNQK